MDGLGAAFSMGEGETMDVKRISSEQELSFPSLSRSHTHTRTHTHTHTHTHIPKLVHTRKHTHFHTRSLFRTGIACLMSSKRRRRDNDGLSEKAIKLIFEFHNFQRNRRSQLNGKRRNGTKSCSKSCWFMVSDKS